ncbi:HTH domain-containing protein, Cro/C1-type [Desulfonema limicola]|uniref:HTH domain-containing protein, Cro/C1-type n=1 Tax=Desulfonema limicola TaxID=45656 RepID=A0A975BAG8_9BACT|nr:helix-turn-helix domain-containing protein [Desulfonema limicola]QTA81639.1 HTH domain-containing protein, Cro/C1-type [Desulfonema limicola]
MTVKINYTNINKIAKVVLFHRKLSGLSRNELADIAGVGKTVIFDIEHGKETVKLSTLLKVMSALNIGFIIDSPVIKQFEETINEES